jgi:hypothetical protein
MDGSSMRRLDIVPIPSLSHFHTSGERAAGKVTNQADSSENHGWSLDTSGPDTWAMAPGASP